MVRGFLESSIVAFAFPRVILANAIAIAIRVLGLRAPGCGFGAYEGFRIRGLGRV